MSKYLTALSFAALCSGAVAAAQAPSAGQGQSPAQPPEAQRPSERPGAADQAADRPAQPGTQTLTGCVYREEDVAGRTPNAAERAGVLEDYILDVSAHAHQSAQSAQSAPGTPGAVGTSGSAAAAGMYKLELVDDEKLRAVVGKRVEVTGRIDAEAGDTRPEGARPTTEAERAIGRDSVSLPEFEVVSIKEVAGSCAAKPADKDK